MNYVQHRHIINSYQSIFFNGNNKTVIHNNIYKNVHTIWKTKEMKGNISDIYNTRKCINNKISIDVKYVDPLRVSILFEL